MTQMQKKEFWLGLAVIVVSISILVIAAAYTTGFLIRLAIKAFCFGFGCSL